MGIYIYETIGGNHSRQALQELLKENPELSRQKLYSQRLCSVYSTMPTSLILRLTSKHNRASVFTHDMSTCDKVECLIMMINIPKSIPVIVQHVE